MTTSSGSRFALRDWMVPAFRIANLGWVGALALVSCSTSSMSGALQGGDAGATADAAIHKVSTPTNHIPPGTTCTASRAAGIDTSIDGGADAGLTCSGTGCCDSDSQCTSGTNGRCLSVSRFSSDSTCSYDTCEASTDCASGSTCGCRADSTSNIANTCIPSNCRDDSDCGANGFCSPSLPDGCASPGVFQGIYCHTPQDECGSDQDCIDPNGTMVQVFGYCRFNQEVGHWACNTMPCSG